MTEQYQAEAAEKNAIVGAIRASRQDLADAMGGLRSEAIQRVGYGHMPSSVVAMLQELDVPAPSVSDMEARRLITERTHWNEDPEDYTPQGLRKQLRRSEEKNMAWFKTLRKHLKVIVGEGLISRGTADVVLDDLGAPDEERTVVQSIITVSASTDVESFTDEAITATAQRLFSDAIRNAIPESFELDSVDVKTDITHSGS